MTASLAQISLFMLAGVAAVIFLTLKCKLHPFFALIVGCLITGLGVELPFAEILKLMKTGIGDVLSKLTLLIVLGTAIGVLLERNGCTQIMADSILKLVGARRSPLALSITGFVVGLPIFCDSGYIVLNGINQRLTRLTSF